jgi:uncharacterized protein
MSPRTRGSARAYVALVFGWTWTFWWAAVLLDVPWSSGTGAVLFALGGLGPVLAAGLLVHLGYHPDPPRRFWRRLSTARAVPASVWVLVAGIALLPAVVGRAAGGGSGPWLQLGAAAVLVTGLLAGVLEEPGWRGYLQEVLQRRHGPLPAALLVGPVWALWHLPLFFLVGSYQHDLGRWNEDVALYLVAVVAWAVVYALVYVWTSGSVLAVVVLHAAANGAGELVPSDGTQRGEVAVVVALALLSAWWLRSRRSAVVAATSAARPPPPQPLPRAGRAPRAPARRRGC